MLLVEQLKKKVNNAIDQGFEPIGGLVISEMV